MAKSKTDCGCCGIQRPPPKTPVLDVFSPTFANNLIAKGMIQPDVSENQWSNIATYIEGLKDGLPGVKKRTKPNCDKIEKQITDIYTTADAIDVGYTTYTLSFTPKENTLSVYVDGIFQNPTYYTLTDDTVVLSFALADGSNASFTYRYDEEDPYCDPYEDPYIAEDEKRFSLRDAIEGICGQNEQFPNGFPSITSEQQDQIWNNRNQICYDIWHGNGSNDLPGLTQPQKNEAIALYELETGLIADINFEAEVAFEAVAGFAFSAEMSVTVSANLSASISVVLPFICFAISLSVSITLEIPLLLVFLMLLAILKAGITLLVLFQALVAGIDIDVSLGLKPLILLLWSLVYPNLGAGVTANISIPIIPVFGVGSGLSIGIGGLQAGINISAMGSIGMSASLGVSASASASASVGASASAGFNGFAAPGPAVAASASVNASAVSGFEMAPGSAVNPNSGAVDSLRKNQRAALCEGVKFGSSGRPPTPEELKNRSIDTETKINIVPINGIKSLITYSNAIKLTDNVIPKTGMNGLRDAINRAKCDESSVIYLFDKAFASIDAKVRYQQKITLAELLLKCMKWDTNMPIDPMVLNLMQQNMPTGVRLNTGFIMLTLGGMESPGLILTPG